MGVRGTVPLSSQQLLLRPYVMEDAPALFQNVTSDPEVCRYLTWTPHESLEVTQNLLKEWIADYENPICYQWGIEYHAQLIGLIGVSQSQLSWEMGFCLGKAWWGQGLITQSIVTMFNYLFLDQNFRRLFSMYAAPNEASGRVMEKCGMTKEGVLRQQFGLLDGSFTDFIIYGILQSEWENFRKMK